MAKLENRQQLQELRAACVAAAKKETRKILVCAGDAENDLSMMKDADYAFAPEDGIIANDFETVCKCADGAVADIIYKKIPEILGLKP